MIKIDLIAGARPNFMKISPLIDAIKRASEKGKELGFRLIHTGQHYDKNMSGSFFEQLGIPEPDFNLGAGGGTQAEQTAGIMVAYEKLLAENGKPDLCLVVGDVTSTMACAIVAQKSQVKVAHVEAGIRSGDWTMPEEINRMVTDSITNYFFTTSETANENLKNLGIGKDRIFYVGNTMIDTLIKHRPRFLQSKAWSDIGLEPGKFLVMTLHRPANVDQEDKLKKLIQKIIDHSQGLPLVFPVHPRTKKMMESIGISHPRLHMIEPLGYLEFNYLVERAKAVVTDSGGITEETTVMGIPCMTLRDNTERPETISEGTNELIGTDPDAIPPAMEKLFSGNWKTGKIPHLWDGNTAERIIKVLMEKLGH
ncbi:MAG: UDP-N-acetylglucosamine 2-epimerase (non-hydrolyzing) [Cyclobacteriaceae bacterium]